MPGDFKIIVNASDFSINLSQNFASAVENPILLPQSFSGLVDVFFANPSGNPSAPWNYIDPVDFASPELSIAQTNAQTPPYLAQGLNPTYFSGSPAYLEFAFDLDTVSMATALGSSPSLKAVFEVDWIPSGTRQLTAQCAIIVSRAIIVSANPAPTPSASYYTQAQTNALFAQILIGSITALSSGAGTLSGIATAGGARALNSAVIFLVSGITNGWFLTAYTSQSGPGYQEPDDFNASTNPVIWQKFI